MSISTIPTVTANTVGTPVLTTVQSKGLPDWYGKKDKTTTEQAYFTCNICECDLKSVITLRVHCGGTQHIRKALQKKKEWRLQKQREREAEEAVNGPKRPPRRQLTTLFDWLDSATSEAVVGLENVTEYQSGDPEDVPYYHCNLEYCKDEQGNAESMKNHLFTAWHKRAWLYVKTGDYLEHQNEISQRIAQFSRDGQRDYNLSFRG